MQYMAVKLDMVSSKKLDNDARAAVQVKFLNLIEQVNTRFGESIVSRFVVTHGDESQGMLYTDRRVDIVPILEMMLDGMMPVKLRFGLGIGTLSTSIKESAIGMDGQAWHRAAQAIGIAHKEKKVVQAIGYDNPFDGWITSICNLLFHQRGRWTDEQRRIIGYRMENMSQNDIARTLGIANPTVSKALTAAAWRTYTEACTTLVSLFDKANRLGDATKDLA